MKETKENPSSLGRLTERALIGLLGGTLLLGAGAVAVMHNDLSQATYDFPVIDVHGSLFDGDPSEADQTDTSLPWSNL